MKIFIVTFGTRGDVQPYVALGMGLQSAGHTVTLCTSSHFESFITEHGLNYGYMNNGLMDLMNSEAGRHAMENTSNLWEGIKTAKKLWKQVGPLQRSMLDDSWEAARQADPNLIIFHPKAFGGPHFAEKLNIPVVMAFYLPMFVPTGESVNLGFPAWKLGRWYNRMTYRLIARLTKLGVGTYVREWRAKHNLLPQPRRVGFLQTTAGDPIPIVHGYSPHVVPVPSDWPSTAMASGYWFLDRPSTWQPPTELLSFLDAGEPTVYVGFGSIAGRDPQRTTQIVIEALQLANVRAVMATGWGGLAAEKLPETIFKIDHAPHDWLFPRMSAVIHHGGVGSTAAGLRAGRPTIICPFFGDQPFWGQRVAQLGVGSAPIPQRKLTAEKLAAAIRDVTTNHEMQQRAELLGAKIRAEDGVANAVAFIERCSLEAERHDNTDQTEFETHSFQSGDSRESR